MRFLKIIWRDLEGFVHADVNFFFLLFFIAVLALCIVHGGFHVLSPHGYRLRQKGTSVDKQNSFPFLA